jgi:hypothetical protein
MCVAHPLWQVLRSVCKALIGLGGTPWVLLILALLLASDSDAACSICGEGSKRVSCF